MNAVPQEPMEFVVGDSLGRLLKWLRILGFSAVLERDIDDCAAENSLDVKKALHLTRSRLRPPAKWKFSVRIQSDTVFDQLKEIIQSGAITREHLRPFSRCIDCNAIIEDIDPERVRGRVPDYVFETHTQFKCCPVCYRIFWQGTHLKNMNAVIDRLFDSESSPTTESPG
jgi:uncharacterized protein with PIN domain